MMRLPHLWQALQQAGGTDWLAQAGPAQGMSQQGHGQLRVAQMMWSVFVGCQVDFFTEP